MAVEMLYYERPLCHCGARAFTAENRPETPGRQGARVSQPVAGTRFFIPAMAVAVAKELPPLLQFLPVRKHNRGL